MKSTPTCWATSSRNTSTRSRWGPTIPRRTLPSYIASNTIIPFLFDATAQEVHGGFRGRCTVWRLLREDPGPLHLSGRPLGVVHDDGTILPSRRCPTLSARACTTPRPACSTAATTWERLIFGTEKVRSSPAAHRDLAGIRHAAASGAWSSREARHGRSCQINDLITLNLDIRQFVQDAIADCQSPELLGHVLRCHPQRDRPRPDVRFGGLPVCRPQRLGAAL